ncbi:MAG TPA: thymidine phosphorylase, partial [Pyrinomonadaceae bacterium]|nr:thymidine phosphorylase [Pyrinomonadaceae bacterium]
TPDEGKALTHSMLYSGEVLDFSDIDAPKADKHSTGGVGDKTSLIIAPLAAACGVAVPMISGRGLGHTGGTLDKLESIPGYNVNLTTGELRSTLRKCGFAMSGQTAEIAPADRKLYALRDATATVSYIPLIVASIMSKKLAEGLDALVLDVKTGSGAFMQRFDDARQLATELVATGKSFGVKVEAVVSDMDQPLGKWVGNAVEVFECIEILRGNIDGNARNTYTLSLELTARMLVLSGIAKDIEAAQKLAESKLASGEALEKLRQNIETQGGDAAVCDDPARLMPETMSKFEIAAASDGFISSVDTFAIGNAIVTLGGGRRKAEDSIDHLVGFSTNSIIGDEVRSGDPLGFVHCRSREQFDSIYQASKTFYKISPEPGESTRSLVRDIISG